MELFILRHGHARSISESGVSSDMERPLSPAGTQDIRRMAGWLRSQGGHPGRILVSPYKRARQTAEVLAACFHPHPPIESYAPLANEVSGLELSRLLDQDHGEVDSLLLVGHQPQLGELVRHLAAVFFEFRPGGLIALRSSESGPMQILYSANPSDIS